MRLIECNQNITDKLWIKLTIDLDSINAIRPFKEGSKIFIRNNIFKTDIPYKKAVDLWENYRTDKGVSTTLD